MHPCTVHTFLVLGYFENVNFCLKMDWTYSVLICCTQPVCIHSPIILHNNSPNNKVNCLNNINKSNRGCRTVQITRSQ